MNYAQETQYTQVILNKPATTNLAHVIVEQPVSLTVNGEDWVTWMCTPINVEQLALGFLYNEGHIKSMGEVEHIRLCDAGDQVDVWLSHSVEKPRIWHRTSGCTGGFTSVSIEPWEPKAKHIEIMENGSFSPTQINKLVAALFENQAVYKQTGGVHTSALSDGEEIIAVAEDVGRHNTLDKLAGRCLVESIDLQGGIILSTGRISSEMLQKGLRMGVHIIVSRTAPTSLSINMAESQGITLIGYARRDRFNIYTHPSRIQT